ncbi:WD40 repeat domain-containing protein [Halobaculum sp. MBLA0147]|uniref:WD40 repeat domain-containing protein n=1 Tax=Halobaculum sp. MBLA0147 TaxID=3079934 RepID=UPI0035256B34
MLLVGTDDGVYAVREASGSRTARVRKRLGVGRVHRLRRFDGVEGVFAATSSGLYHGGDGDEWTALSVPREQVYAVGCDPATGRLFAGTRPAHVYVADAVAADGTVADTPAWTEITAIQELPSRDEWRLPRHDDLAQIRDVVYDGDRLAVGVEVGGVVVGEDGSYRSTEGVYDDVHELSVTGPGAYVAATGSGLYRTDDAGETWDRLDEDVPQRYFRRVHAVGDTVYAAGALANSSTWNDPDADPALYAVDGDGLRHVPLPRDDETVTGMTTVDGSLVAVTHLGGVFHRRGDGWRELPAVPVVEGRVAGRYTPVTPA